MQYFEMVNIHDIAALKAFVENRLSDVKKVSNTSFEDMMKEYDKNVDDWEKRAMRMIITRYFIHWHFLL